MNKHYLLTERNDKAHYTKRQYNRYRAGKIDLATFSKLVDLYCDTQLLRGNWSPPPALISPR